MSTVCDRLCAAARRGATVAAVVALVAVADARAQGAVGRDSSLLQRLLVAEDARRRDPMAVAVFHQGLRSPDAMTRRVAVRALGRLENSTNYSAVVRMLADSSAVVRSEAVNAMGQVVRPQSGGAAVGVTAVQVRDALVAHLANERDGHVRSVVARTIGRLPYASREDAERAARVVLAVKAYWDRTGNFATSLDSAAGAALATWESADTAVLGAWRNVAHGMESVFRRNPALRVADLIPASPVGPGAAGPGQAAGEPGAGMRRDIRSLLALVRGRALAQIARGTVPPATPPSVLGRAFPDDAADPDPAVRRIAVALTPNAVGLSESTRAAIVRRALGDSAAAVRLDAVRAYARRAGDDCAPLVSATRDPDAHVALAAIDALGTACASSPGVADTLAALVGRLPASAARRAGRGSWHYGAHAIVSLARVAPARARAALPRLIAHPVWQVRMYAARAAVDAGDTTRLFRFAGDRHDNVREAAVDGLGRVFGRADTTRAPRPGGALERRADSVFVAQLARPDYQLVLTAARSLRGTAESATAMRSLLAALDRITAERRETSRDPRIEILARVGELGRVEHAPRLDRYLVDFDPVIAARAAEILRQWGRTDAVAAPRPPAPVALSEVVRLRDRRVRVTMAAASGGGSFEVMLFPDEAPATVAQFASLARRGYYDGLTFHRVAPNFVLQGGSPGANEYMGAGPYMRDELGLRSHTRGTLGISTRGRDTGDAQIFINLVDNWRLDHDYTVFGEIVSGMDVVDRILEGDIMQRVEIVAEPRLRAR